MGKALEISDMPPLTPEMHDELRALERGLRLELRSCCNRYEVIDPHAAFEYARTYAVQFYDLYYGFYSQIPDPKYRPHWRPASETFAFDRVVRCIENNSGIRAYFANDTTRTQRIRRTISDHAERNPIPTIPIDLQPPNRPGVFAPVSVAARLKALKRKSRLSAQKIADGIGVDLRTVQRHLSGTASPRDAQILAYEKFFTNHLGEPTKIENMP